MVRSDAVVVPDVRVTLQTNHSHLIVMSYNGFPARVSRSDGSLGTREPVESSEYYFRIALRFETASEQYGPMTATSLGSVEKSRSGVAAGVLNSARETGSALGVALFGSFIGRSDTFLFGARGGTYCLGGVARWGRRSDHARWPRQGITAPRKLDTLMEDRKANGPMQWLGTHGRTTHKVIFSHHVRSSLTAA